MFRYYGKVAHKLEHLQLRPYAPKDIKEYIEGRARKADKELIIKRVVTWKSTMLYLAYWVLMTTLGFVVYGQSSDTILILLWIRLGIVIVLITAILQYAQT